MPSDPIHIQQTITPTAAQSEIEIVERKGLGHPDTICDLVMENISQALSKAYIDRFGRILHHNCDKGLLVAGQAEHRLGGGRVIEPMRLVIGDRATLVREFDVGEIAVETARRWFHDHLPEVDPKKNLVCQVELKGGSEELTGIFHEASTIAAANDTSAAVGYAPLSETERLVLEAEKFLNGRDFKQRFPASGQDVKIMGLRRHDELDLTVAMPLLDRFVESEASYCRQKEEIREFLLAYINSRLNRLRHVNVSLNTLDRPGVGSAGMYLSVLGTSAEDADSGEVGRGNQVNGIIALNRPRGSEAAAGKNPVSHVGKIYSVLTHLLAERIYQEIEGAEQVVVWLCSRIGAPVNEPQVAAVLLTLKTGAKLADSAEPVRQIVRRELERMPQFGMELARGKYPVC
ncbi:MAG TPA: methionine adenosyltransferase [Candidatus Limnocylindria bacterium]|nr:methionine adenosyltransferase [Candidatus Limnocylindria bacterium]